MPVCRAKLLMVDAVAAQRTEVLFLNTARLQRPQKEYNNRSKGVAP